MRKCSVLTALLSTCFLKKVKHLHKERKSSLNLRTVCVYAVYKCIFVELGLILIIIKPVFTSAGGSKERVELGRNSVWKRQ